MRSRLIAWLAQRTCLASYSLVSLALIVWIILAAGRAPYLPLWEPVAWQALVPLHVSTTSSLGDGRAEDRNACAGQYR